MDVTSMAFPFRIDELGKPATQTGDANMRARIVQILLTSPGERVDLPDFGCGLRDLVFDPNNEVLAATMEFTIGKALQRWMPDDIFVNDVNIDAVDNQLERRGRLRAQRPAGAGHSENRVLRGIHGDDQRAR